MNRKGLKRTERDRKGPNRTEKGLKRTDIGSKRTGKRIKQDRKGLKGSEKDRNEPKRTEKDTKGKQIYHILRSKKDVEMATKDLLSITGELWKTGPGEAVRKYI